MKKNHKINPHSTNLAAEFFVASQLNRLNFIVTITLGNTKEVDLLALRPDGKTITIDTKGLKNKSNWPVSAKRIRDDHFFILVSYTNQFSNTEHNPEVFIVPSTELKKILDSWAGKPNKTCVNYRDVKNGKYKNAWPLLFKNINQPRVQKN